MPITAAMVVIVRVRGEMRLAKAVVGVLSPAPSAMSCWLTGILLA